jgi:hypothetical protein
VATPLHPKPSARSALTPVSPPIRRSRPHRTTSLSTIASARKLATHEKCGRSWDADMSEFILRCEAIAQGLPRYRTGKACNRGHFAERMTRNADCVECIATKRAKPLTKRTAEQNRLRNERLAQQRRALHSDELTETRRVLGSGLAHAMQSAEALERGRYLDNMIRENRNAANREIE